LADFIADWTPGAQEEVTKDTEAWTIFCDGSWGTFGAGAAEHAMQQDWTLVVQTTLLNMKLFYWGFGS
jgi:hypothetical protein